jgi:hypothetical protein
MSILAVAAGLKAAYGVGQAIAGHIKDKRAQGDVDQARGDLETTRYGDLNRAYYDRLTERSRFGLDSEERRYLEDQAERASGIGLRAAEDRRAGLMGIGRSTRRLSDAYRQIGIQDINEKTRKEEAQLAELNNRGNMAYNERMGLANLDMALARGDRQEANRLTQAGAQNIASGLTSVAFDMSQQGLGADDRSANTKAFFSSKPQSNSPFNGTYTNPLTPGVRYGNPFDPATYNILENQ